MKIFKKKVAYVYKQNPKGYFTVLLSHPYYDYAKHCINQDGIPLLYFKTIDKTFKQLFKDYKLIFRKPQKTAIRRLQLTVLLDVYQVEKPRMKMKKPFDKSWQQAVNIYWETIWFRALGIDLCQEHKKFKGLTVEIIYASLVLESRNISFN